VAENQLQAALQSELQQGLVEVERRDGKVVVTVGAGGAFSSGKAEITDQAREIMNRISVVSMGAESTITVSGHTDDVPISNTAYRDNWDLAAARASSVVQAMQDTGMVSAGRMKAVSYGETQPVASNSTPEGREENRRIVIEIDFAQGD
jgi:chemotaxis protein MotB